MPSSRRNKEGLLARVNFPLYTLQMLTGRHVLVAGGGGSSKTGVANGFEIFELSHDGKRFVAEEQDRHETGSKVVMNCATYSSGKKTFLVAGQESHCQLYDVAITVIKDAKKENPQANGKLDGNLRKRKSSQSDSNVNDSSKVNGNSNLCRRLQFKFIDLKSIQTDFTKVEPVQRVVRISRCGKLMVTGGIDGHVRLWSFPELKPVCDIDAHKKEIDDVDFSPDSKMVVSVSKDGQAVIWDCEKGSKIHSLIWTPPNGSKYLFKRSRFGPVEDDRKKSRIYTISNAIGKPQQVGCFIHQWNAVTGSLERSVTVNESLSALAVRDDGRFLAVGTMFSGTVNIYIAFSLQRTMTVKNAHSTFVTGLEFLPSQGTVISPASEAAVLSISIDNKVCIHSLPYRRTLPPWLVIVLMVFTLFCAFVFCSYIGL